jgi:hypothetical protein
MESSFNDTLQGVQRLPKNTTIGNPHYRVWGMTGSWLTEPDAQVNFLVPNHVGKPVRITLNEHGRVIQVSPVE